MVRFACSVAAAAVMHSAAVAAEGRVTLNAGADHASGAYGKTETTDVSQLHFGAKYESGPWTYRLSVPFLRISGPANVVGIGGDSVVLPGEAGGRRRVSGLGDLAVGAGYNVMGGTTGPVLVDVGAKIKLATADETKGLGTGKNDYSVQAEVFRPTGPVAPFAMLGYRWYGDPAGIELRNALFGSLGLAYRDASGTTFGLTYDFRQRIVAGGARVSESMLFISHPLEPQLKLQIYFVKGFSDASPDAGLGGVLAYSF